MYELIFIFISLAYADDNLLNEFQICKRSDPNVNACLKEAIQKALPYIEYGIENLKIPSLQPLEVDEWTTKGTEVVPFEQKYKEIRVYNNAYATIDEVQSSITDNDFSIYIKGSLPVLKFVAQYRYDDAIFFEYNLTGNGTLIFVQTGTVFFVNMTGQVNRNGNKPTLQIISSFHESSSIEGLDINLEHVHIEISTKSSEHVSKHWLVLFNELRVYYSEIYAHQFKNIANAIFSLLDYDKIFPK
ncbi:hypothetical protein FQR65_LT02928 [Abscondita terminalis]|nr:hypothetical protein FQR65_LT02928 [Abscondita terminalis]